MDATFLFADDSACDRTWEDTLIAETAQAQGRLVLTRDKAALRHCPEPRTKHSDHAFHRCSGCQRISWPGSHHAVMAGFLAGLKLD